METIQTGHDGPPSGSFETRTRLRRKAGVALLVCAAYYVGARIGFAFSIPPVHTSVFWLPNSIVFAVLLLTRRRNWPLYVLATLPAHFAAEMQSDVPRLTMLLLFLTNIGDAVLGALIVRHFSRGRPRFDSLHNVLTFIAAAVISPLLVGFLDAAVAVITGWAPDYWLVWQTRLRSNVLTNLLWIPTIVVACTRGYSWARQCSASRWVEAACLALAVTFVGGYLYGAPWTDPAISHVFLYLPLPLFMWAAVRFGVGGTSAALLWFALLVIRNAVLGTGPFVEYSASSAVLVIQVFLTSRFLPLLIMATLFDERRRAELELREREAQYRSIFQAVSDGVLITDLNHRPVAVNPAFGRITGYGSDALATAHPREFLHLDDLESFDAYLTRVSAGDAPVVRALCLQRDRSLSQLEICSTRFNYSGRPHVLSLVREVTERERVFHSLEQRVAERTRELSTLLRISNTITSTLQLTPLMNVVLEQLQSVVRYSGAAVLMEEDEKLVIGAYRGPLPASEIARMRVASAQDWHWPAVRRDSPLIVDDVHEDCTPSRAFRAAMPQVATGLFSRARSIVAVPLITRGRSIGFLVVAGAEPRQYTAHEAQLTWLFANQAAVAIDNAQLYDEAREFAAFEERQRLARDLHDSVSQTLHAIAMTCEYLPRLWEQNPAESRAALNRVSEMAHIAFAELRTLLVELRPAELLNGNLAEQLGQLLDVLRGRLSVTFETDLDRSVTLPPDAHVEFYRIAQESLNNIAKHAAASTVEVALRASGAAVTLHICDDGRGFDMQQREAGLGLRIMQERARKLDAVLMVRGVPGAGTTVSLTWNPSLSAEPA